MKPFLLIAAATALLSAGNAFAYQVWMGTHLAQHSMGTNLPAWSRTAAQLQGVNINRAPNPTNPATTADWKTIISQFTNATNVMTEMARSEPSRNPALTNELLFPNLAAELAQKFTEAGTYGYSLDFIMFYDNALTINGTNYSFNWTTIEAQYLRDWLDTNGHAGIQLIYDARNNSQANRNWCTSPLVDHVLIEANADELLNNAHNQVTLLQWIWTNSVTLNKKVLLQIPRSGNTMTQYSATRQVAQMLGTVMGFPVMQNSRLVLLPVTYIDTVPYLPETDANDQLYTNTLTSLCLSLIEQRNLFEGRLPQLPTVADADSLVRNTPPTISSITNQTVNEAVPTAALPFTVSDDLTPPASLVVKGSSSNTNLVPNANIILGGSGANRTLTVSPVASQTGTTTIQLVASDGTFTGTNNFLLTVAAGPDTDGDGMADGSEILLGRNPNSAADLAFEFNADGNFDGWGTFANITNATVASGVISGVSTNGDPHFQRSGFNFAGNSVSNLVVKIRLLAPNTAQFFWGRVGATAFSSARQVNAAYTATNAWQLVTFPLATNAEWQGQTITSLRIDPGTVDGQTFAIDWVRAMSGNPNVISLNSARFTNGMFSMNINGQAGLNYVVQSSTNLTAWQPVWTNSSTAPPLNFNAATANSSPCFYRVLLGL